MKKTEGTLFHAWGPYESQLAARKKAGTIPHSFIIKRGGGFFVLRPKTVRTGTNPSIKGRRGRNRAGNPRQRTLIYPIVNRIEATKGKDSKFPGQKFFHNFKRPYPEMIGLPDGTILIRSKRK